MPPVSKKPNGLYQLRKKLPEDYAVLLGRAEIKRSLGTKQHAEAYELASSVWELMLDELEAQLREQAPPSQLSLRQIEALCDMWLEDKLDEVKDDDAALVLWFTESIYLPTELSNDSNSEAGAAHYLWESLVTPATFPELQNESLQDKAQRYRFISEITSVELSVMSARCNLRLPAGSNVRARFELPLLKRFILLKQAAHKYLNAEFTFKPSTPLSQDGREVCSACRKERQAPVQEVKHVSAATPSISSITWNEAVERWKKSVHYEYENEDRAVERIKDYSAALERFSKFLGTDAIVRSISKETMRSFIETLRQLPASKSNAVKSLPLKEQIDWAKANGVDLLSNNTVRNNVVHVSAVLSHSKSLGFLDENVALEMIPSKTQKARTLRARNDYSAAEITKLFSSPLFTQNERPTTRDIGEAAYWVPVIMYYTGARLSEICQLHTPHVYFDKNRGYSVISIEESHGATSVKERSSVRLIPVPEALVELGFTEYVNNLPSGSPLFPSKRQATKPIKSGNFTKWWSEYVNDVLGELQDRKPAHAFRHTFKSQHRMLNVREDITDAIVGHSGRGAGSYYGDFLDACKQHIDLIPKLELEPYRPFSRIG